MTARPLLPGTPLTPEHARQLDALAATLNREEALWISGYLAGLARQPDQPALAQAAPETLPLTILYASETGHAAALARRAEARARERGLAVRIADMAAFPPREVGSTRHLLILASTHGDGDPPQAAADFFDFIQSRRAPRLEGMQFAVLGLGDSSYERFCQTGKDLDRRLEVLGARRLHDRADCDVDYEEPAAAWLEAVLDAFARETRTTAGGAAAAPAPTVAPRLEGDVSQVDQNHPFRAAILDNLVLNGRGSDKETRHIELSLAGSGLAWEPGDSLGVLPQNDPALVDQVLSVLHFKADEAVPHDGGDIPLAEALLRRYEVTTLTPGFLQGYGATVGAEALQALAKPGSEADRRRYMAGRQIIDVLNEFPPHGLDARTFLALLRKLPPRLYSLASSPAAYPDEAHLTVAVVRYESLGRKRQGVASGYLAERCGNAEMVPVYLSPNPKFRLPADPAIPIIMIGAGTGVAPFRAFLQAREAAGAPGRNWLFFGERRFRTDFLYQTEWQRLVKAGLLTRMDVAFSRDQEDKVYVQHRLRKQGREVYAWLEEGACLYVCGDASHLAPDVHAALADLVAEAGGMGPKRAEQYLKQLQRERRYQRDVY